MSDHPKVKVTSEGLHAIADEIVALVVEKNAAYADSWQVFGPLEAMLRTHVKAARYLAVSKNSHIVMFSDESIDSLRDIIGHALLALLYFSEVYEADEDQAEEETQERQKSAA